MYCTIQTYYVLICLHFSKCVSLLVSVCLQWSNFNLILYRSCSLMALLSGNLINKSLIIAFQEVEVRFSFCLTLLWAGALPEMENLRWSPLRWTCSAFCYFPDQLHLHSSFSWVSAENDGAKADLFMCRRRVCISEEKFFKYFSGLTSQKWWGRALEQEKAIFSCTSYFIVQCPVGNVKLAHSFFWMFETSDQSADALCHMVILHCTKT